MGVYVYNMHVASAPPPPPPEGNNPSLCKHLQARPFLASSILAASVHLGTQAASVGVLQAVGAVRAAEAFSFALLSGHPHTSEKHRPHIAGSKL